jgi:hypothetical protein
LERIGLTHPPKATNLWLRVLSAGRLGRVRPFAGAAFTGRAGTLGCYVRDLIGVHR